MLEGTPTKAGTGQDLPPASTKNGAVNSDTIDLAVSDPRHSVLESTLDLAFFTASAGRTEILPTLTALGSGNASASNGNGMVSQNTFVAATLTISYTYLPQDDCLIKPGTYSIVQTPEVPGFLNGKESQQGDVLPTNGPPQALSVTITDADSPHNDFAKLLPTTDTNATPHPLRHRHSNPHTHPNSHTQHPDSNTDTTPDAHTDPTETPTTIRRHDPGCSEPVWDELTRSGQRGGGDLEAGFVDGCQ